MKLKSIIMAVLIIASYSLIFLIPAEKTSAVTPDDQIDGLQYLTGDWSITNFAEEYTNETIILTGNISSFNKLTLKNTVIKINSSSTQNFNINFYSSGGNLTLQENSVITANNTLYPYDLTFRANSNAYIHNSTISYAGYAGGESEGISILSSSVVFDNALISNNYNGIVCSTSSPTIVNSVIENSVNKDVVLKGTSKPIFINTVLDKNKVEVTEASLLAINWYLSISVTNQSVKPIPGVTVTIKNATGETMSSNPWLTDSNGMISNIILPECIISPTSIAQHSPFSIIMEKEDYKTKIIENVELTQSRTLDLNMTLKPKDGTISGTVTDSSGDPITGAKVTLSKNDFEIAVDYTNTTGGYEILDVPEDSGYTVIASKDPEYIPQSDLSVEVVGEATTIVNFVLDIRPLPLTVDPPDGAKNVSANTTITLVFEEIIDPFTLEEFFELKNLDTGGNIDGTWISADNITFIFIPDSSLAYENEFRIRVLKSIENETGEKPFWKDFISYFNTVLASPKIKTYQPVATENVPIGSEIIISFDQSMDTSSVQNAITILPSGTMQFQWSLFEGNENASVKIIYSLNPETKYQVSVGTAAKSERGISLEEPFLWEFTTETIEKYGSITGKVVDENDKPIKNAQVKIFDADVEFIIGTDLEGDFLIENIPEGVYDVEITVDGFNKRILDDIVILEGPPYNTMNINLERIPVEKEKKEEDDLEASILAGYIIAIILFIMILVVIVLMSLSSKKETEERPGREPRYIELGLGRETVGEGEEEVVSQPPPYRGRCPVCKHSVYGDYGCFHCASSGGSNSYMYADEG